MTSLASVLATIFINVESVLRMEQSIDNIPSDVKAEHKIGEYVKISGINDQALADEVKSKLDDVLTHEGWNIAVQYREADQALFITATEE